MMERSLKKSKAFVRSGNQRNHVVEGMFAGDTSSFASQVASAELKSPPWNGGGVSVLRFGVCFLKNLRIAGWNVIEGFRFLMDNGIPGERMLHFGLDALQNVNSVSCTVGTDWTDQSTHVRSEIE